MEWIHNKTIVGMAGMAYHDGLSMPSCIEIARPLEENYGNNLNTLTPTVESTSNLGTQESLDILTVRRLFIFLKENLIFESMQDDLMERNLLNEREQEDCNSRNRYFRIEALLKIIMRKRRCKEFVAFIHEIPGEKHVSEKIVQFQKEQIEQERERQTGSMGNEQPKRVINNELLQKRFVFLYMEVEPRDIADEMFQEEDISISDHDSVTDYDMKYKRLRNLLKILKEREKYASFTSILNSRKYMSILKTLQEDKPLMRSPSKYEECIQSNFTLLQEELPGTGHASVIMEHVLDPSNISDMQSCNGTRRKISRLLKMLLEKGEPACKELFRVVETDLKKGELIQQMIDRNDEIMTRGKPELTPKLQRLTISCIHNHRDMFYEELEPINICDLLFEERAMQFLVHEKITGKKQRQKQTKHLLRTIEKNENDCFHLFLYILCKNKNKFILEPLEMSSKRVVSAETEENLTWHLSQRVEIEADNVQNKNIELEIAASGSCGSEVENSLYRKFHSPDSQTLEQTVTYGQVIEDVSHGSVIIQLRPITDHAVKKLLDAKNNNCLLEMIFGMLLHVNIANLMNAEEDLVVKVRVLYASSAKVKPDLDILRTELIKKRVKAYKSEIFSKLEPNAIASFLSKSKTIQKDVIDSIKNGCTCTERSENLLSFVTKGNSNDVEQFVAALKNLGHFELVELVDPADIHGKAEEIRRSIITNFKTILNEMQITLAKETLSSCIGDVDAIKKRILPENGSRKQRMGHFLQFILQDDHNVIEFEKMLRRNSLNDLLKIVETMEEEQLPTKNIEITVVKDNAGISSEKVLFESAITLSYTGKFEKLTDVRNVKGKAVENPEGVSSETKTEKLIFEQWGKENKKFVLTRACTEVEKLCRKQNLVIVTGHSGAGKTAIIHHIALRYRNEGWTVKSVAELNEIIHSMNSSKDKDDNGTLFVLNDPIGKELLDVLQFYSGTRHEEHIEACLKKVKLIVSCRKYILMDPRVKGVLKNKSNIINISTDQLKMSNNEKREVWDMHSCNKNISEEELEEICQTEAYFPLLCKLYSTNENKQNNILRFFKEPVVVFEEEIRDFRNSCKEKYCALILLVLFGNTFCVDVVRESEQMKKQFKVALELCGMIENTSLYVMKDTLKSLEGCFVKKIGHTYHFYHDFVMEVTTYVFGQDYPVETIKYADTSFLRKRVKLRASSDDNDQFTIYLSDQHIHYLGKRLFDDIFTEHLLDVVCNPCLKNEKIVRLFIEELDRQPEKIIMLLEKKKIQFDSEKFNQTSKYLYFSKLVFVNTNEGISPFLALVVFGHTHIFLHCIQVLDKMQVSINLNDLFSAVCCNGSFDIFAMILKDNVKKFKSVKWVSFYPIHIVSVFHNYEILRELIQVGVDVNLKTDQDDYWTPLTLAAANNTEENDSRQTCESSQSRRDSTIKLLLENGASVNQCTKDGVSPLFTACSNGYDSTVELLLNHRANIHICTKNSKNPLHAACEKGHHRTVKMLLKYGADINICMENKVSPLLLACLKGHENTVQVLLENGADVNFCDEDEVSPLYLACGNGLEKIANLILKSGADINICMENGANPFHVACQMGHENTVQLLLKNGTNINTCMEKQTSPFVLACKYGHDKIVQLLLTNGADIFLCTKEGNSPLHIACQNGYTNIVLTLLTNGLDINSCNRKGCSPLFLACGEGHHATVQMLLSHGADIDLYDNDGATPLYIACQNGHTKIVQLLLSNRANLNLHILEGCSPLHIACQNGHGDIAKLLLQNGAEINFQGETIASPVCVACYHGHDIIAQLLIDYDADINLCTELGTGPLFYACKNGHEKVVQLLLRNGADINLCTKIGESPLFIACQMGYDHISQVLLNDRADKNLCTENGASPLHIACQEGHETILQMLLNHRADINLTMENGASPLFIACNSQRDSSVQLLLKNGADINLCTQDEFSPLLIACKNGYDSTTKILLKNGADINACQRNGTSPLILASANGHERTVQILLSNGANINACKNNGASPLLVACINGHENIVKLLLKNGADINLSPDHGGGPLITACCKGYYDIVLLLLRFKADINLCDENGSALSEAVLHSHERIVQLLLSNGADTNLRMANGAVPLHAASQNGNLSIVNYLLSHQADINMCMEHEVSPLFIACLNGKDRVVELLLRNGAYINLCIDTGCSPLIVACQNEHERTVEILLQFGADTNIHTKYGASPLCVAFAFRNCKIVKMLLDSGADTSIANLFCFDYVLSDCSDKDITSKFLLQPNAIFDNLYDPDSFFSLFVFSQVANTIACSKF